MLNVMQCPVLTEGFRVVMSDEGISAFVAFGIYAGSLGLGFRV